MKSKNKNSARQFVYRQKVKSLGGMYVGAYVKGTTAKALKREKEAGDKSYSDIINNALRHSLSSAHIADLGPVTKVAPEYDWEDFK